MTAVKRGAIAYRVSKDLCSPSNCVQDCCQTISSVAVRSMKVRQAIFYLMHTSTESVSGCSSHALAVTADNRVFPDILLALF